MAKHMKRDGESTRESEVDVFVSAEPPAVEPISVGTDLAVVVPCDSLEVVLVSCELLELVAASLEPLTLEPVPAESLSLELGSVELLELVLMPSEPELPVIFELPSALQTT